MFYPTLDINHLRLLITSPGSQAVNQLVLAREARALCEMGIISLRPFGSTQDHIRLDFSWNLEAEPSNATTRSVRLHDERSCRDLETGDVVHLSSRDINRWPLPDHWLLKLQFDLNRALSASTQPPLLRLVFRDNAYEDPPKKGNSEDARIDANGEGSNAVKVACQYTPHFALFLIDRALQEGIIRASDVAIWKSRFNIDVDGDVDMPCPALEAQYHQPV